MAGQRGVRGFWPEPAQQGETDALRRSQRQNEVKGWPAPVLDTLPLIATPNRADPSWAGRTIIIKDPVINGLNYAYMCMPYADGTYHWNRVAVLDDNGNLILPKTSGVGIKVDTTTPTFPWHDLLGFVHAVGVGATDPTWSTFQGNIKQYQFTVGDEVWNNFHIPHDYVPGSDLFLHVHWAHAATTVTGGSVTWGFDITYAKGHNQAAFPATVNTTIAQNASTTQYQHMLAEVQISAASPSGSQIASNVLEPDGILLVRTYLSANAITVSGGLTPEPFAFYVDVHYQSTNIGTKQKAPNFYT